MATRSGGASVGPSVEGRLAARHFTNVQSSERCAVS
jgi:hypothetical protein